MSSGVCSASSFTKIIFTLQVDDSPEMPGLPVGPSPVGGAISSKVPAYLKALPEPQWLQCDVRLLDMDIIGKFGVIMADPPWAIHQDLPYGTMEDEEMRKLNIGVLQDQGVILLWVTG